MRVDLHIHSTCSDGCLKPGEIISLAARKGLSVISIADHDTVNHFEESKREAEKRQLALIPAVEFSAFVSGQEVHILGYAPDQMNANLTRHLDQVRSRRTERAHRILERLGSHNIHIPHSELDLIPQKTTIGRLIIARLLLKHGYVRSINEAFDRYLGNRGSAFVPYEPADAIEVIALIRECGGISVFAHPSLQELENPGPVLCEAGLEGVEAYRPGLTENESLMVVKKADELGLLLTGGSDWHCEGGRFNLGDFFVDSGRIKDFLELAGVSA
ncbi:MAG TPA: PHP domain-containing protein [archaeon]|nr:PHP domain-containing protein [archaeon]